MKRVILGVGMVLFLFAGLMERSVLAEDLMEASRKGDTATVLYLLAHGGNVNEYQYGETPLNQAAANDHANVVRILLVFNCISY